MAASQIIKKRRKTKSNGSEKIGVDVPQVLAEHLFLQLFGIGQIAVMRQHQTKGRIDVERL